MLELYLKDNLKAQVEQSATPCNVSEIYISGIHRLEITPELHVTFCEYMGGRWVALGPAEKYSSLEEIFWQFGIE